MSDHICGPEHHVGYFEAVRSLTTQFPELSKIYSVTCIDHETDLMGISFTKECSLKEITGSNKTVSSFINISDLPDNATEIIWWNHRTIGYLKPNCIPQSKFGPSVHSDFFNSFYNLSETFPEESKQYALSCTVYISELLGVDFSTHGGERRIVGRTIETTYKEKPKEVPEICCDEWCPVGEPCKCCDWWA